MAAVSRLLNYTRQHAFANGATRATPVARDRSLADLKSALAELDGLFAGFKYEDEMTSSSPSASSSTHSPPPDQCSKATHDNKAGTAAASRSEQARPRNAFGIPGLNPTLLQDKTGAAAKTNPERLEQFIHNYLESESIFAETTWAAAEPMDRSWAALRTLRAALEFHFSLFQEACSRLDKVPRIQGQIQDLRRHFSTPQELRETGLLVFRDALEGESPAGIAEVFAFASLAYCISKLLHHRGRIPKDDILSGLMIWREAITCSVEKEAFDELARELWPEAHDVVHCIPLGHIPTPQVPLSLLRTTSTASTSQPSPLSRPPNSSPPTLPVDLGSSALPEGGLKDIKTYNFPMQNQGEANRESLHSPARIEAGCTHDPPAQADNTAAQTYEPYDHGQAGPDPPYELLHGPFFNFALDLLLDTHETFDFGKCRQDPCDDRPPPPGPGALHARDPSSTAPEPGGSSVPPDDAASWPAADPALDLDLNEYVCVSSSASETLSMKREEDAPMYSARLMGTRMFRLVCEYIDHDMAELLSRIGVKSSNVRVMRRGKAAQRIHDKCQRDIIEGFLNPLRHRVSGGDRRVLAFLGMASALISLGCLASPREVAMYLNSVAIALAPTLWLGFSECVMKQLNAAEQGLVTATSPLKRDRPSPEGAEDDDQESERGLASVTNKRQRTLSTDPQQASNHPTVDERREVDRDKSPAHPERSDDAPGSEGVPAGIDDEGDNNAGGGVFPCRLGCGRTYMSIQNRDRHERTDPIHGAVVQTCSFPGCLYKNSRRDRLRVHWSKRHDPADMPSELMQKGRAPQRRRNGQRSSM